MIIAVDFDNTLIEKVKYPSIKNYKLKKNVKNTLEELSRHNKLILCTSRHGWYFIPAVLFIKKHKLPIKIHYGKPSADIYIDDKNLGCKGIDWLEIKELILKEVNTNADK